MRLQYWDWPGRALPTSIDGFSSKAEDLIHEALGDTTDQQDLRKWAWLHAVFPSSDAGLPATAREAQTLRLVRFIETGSFDEPKT